MPLAVVCAVAWGHVDVLVHAATEGYLGICGPAAPWGPCWCPCSVLPLRPMWVSTVSAAPEAMLLSVATMMSEVWAVAKGCFDARGLCCHQRPCWGLALVLMLETMWLSVIRAAADHKGQGSYFCSDIHDCRFTIEKEVHRRLLWRPLPPPYPTSPLK